MAKIAANPIRKGELIAVKETRTWVTLANGYKRDVVERWTIGIATACTRDGLVKSWTDPWGTNRVLKWSPAEVFHLPPMTFAPDSIMELLKPDLPAKSGPELVALLKRFRPAKPVEQTA